VEKMRNLRDLTGSNNGIEARKSVEKSFSSPVNTPNPQRKKEKEYPFWINATALAADIFFGAAFIFVVLYSFGLLHLLK
jgi:hypothetical protein